MEKIHILNAPICSISMSELLAQFKHGFLVTPNVDHLVRLQKDPEFYKIYSEADWVICDSKIVNLGAKFLGITLKEVIPGSSFFPAYYNYHRNNDSIKIFLLGAAPGVAQVAMNNINEKVNRRIIVGAYSPSFGFEKNTEECKRIIDIINDSGANVLVVGVGAPKQEKWIYRYKHELTSIHTFMALGATIDFEAGNIKRASYIYQKLHLEWLYRLISEPKRLWKRYLVDDMPFFFYLFKQKLGIYTDPFVKKVNRTIKV